MKNKKESYIRKEIIIMILSLPIAMFLGFSGQFENMHKLIYYNRNFAPITAPAKAGRFQ